MVDSTTLPRGLYHPSVREQVTDLKTQHNLHDRPHGKSGWLSVGSKWLPSDTTTRPTRLPMGEKQLIPPQHHIGPTAVCGREVAGSITVPHGLHGSLWGEVAGHTTAVCGREVVDLTIPPPGPHDHGLGGGGRGGEGKTYYHTTT